MHYSLDMGGSGTPTETVDSHRVSHQTNEFSAMLRLVAECEEGWVSNR
jgi:hypothetical protein